MSNTPDPTSNPSASQYQPKSQISVPPAQHTAGPHGALPFTGADVFALVVIAACCIASGGILFRASRKPNNGGSTPVE